jgi:hypothetical protein
MKIIAFSIETEVLCRLFNRIENVGRALVFVKQYSSMQAVTVEECS